MKGEGARARRCAPGNSPEWMLGWPEITIRIRSRITRDLAKLAALTFLAALTLLGCKPSKPATPVALDLSIYFTCDTRGRLVPCGCFTGQYGGLTRLKTVLDADTSTNSIRVDVGDAIKGREDFNRIEYKYLLRAYAGMNFDALNLGHREAQLSAKQLREIKAASPAPLISANLLDKATGTPLFEGWRIIRRGGFRIALVGVLDPNGFGESLGDGLAVERMESTLSRILPEVKKQADILILLAFTDEATLARLAQEFYEFDLILGGKVSQPSQKLEKVNRSLILFTTNESRALGRLRARIAGRGQLQPVEHEILLMKDHIPQHESVLALAREYRDEIRATKLAIDDSARLSENTIPGVRQAAAFAGSESCLKCHPSAAKVWQRSGHAEAFATLRSKKADADPNCIGCHTVGFGTPTGYRREFAGAKLADVGCESCHGPGSLHVKQHEAQSAVTFKFRPLGAGDCKQCHHGEFSRPFDWDAFWPDIKHGKEPVKTAERKP